VCTIVSITVVSTNVVSTCRWFCCVGNMWKIYQCTKPKNSCVDGSIVLLFERIKIIISISFFVFVLHPFHEWLKRKHVSANVGRKSYRYRNDWQCDQRTETCNVQYWKAVAAVIYRLFFVPKGSECCCSTCPLSCIESRWPVSAALSIKWVNIVIDCLLLTLTLVVGSETWHIGPVGFGQFILVHKLIFQVLQTKNFPKLLSVCLQRWEVIIKMNLREVGLESVDWIYLVQEKGR
jgi:hypothetical protein